MKKVFEYDLSDEITPDFSRLQKDNTLTYLSNEDKEALHIGRKMLKSEKEKLHKVNNEFRHHLKGNPTIYRKKYRKKHSILMRFIDKFFR